MTSLLEQIKRLLATSEQHIQQIFHKNYSTQEAQQTKKHLIHSILRLSISIKNRNLRKHELGTVAPDHLTRPRQNIRELVQKFTRGGSLKIEEIINVIRIIEVDLDIGKKEIESSVGNVMAYYHYYQLAKKYVDELYETVQALASSPDPQKTQLAVELLRTHPEFHPVLKFSQGINNGKKTPVSSYNGRTVLLQPQSINEDYIILHGWNLVVTQHNNQLQEIHIDVEKLLTMQ